MLELKKTMRIYLDNCCYNRPYDDQEQVTISLETQAKLLIQNGIKAGEYELVSSYMLRYENSQNPFGMRRDAIEEFVEENAKYIVDATKAEELESSIQKIMATGIKYKDACHVAAAEYAGCVYFISTDKRLLHYRTDTMKIVNPIEFVSEMEDGNI